MRFYKTLPLIICCTLALLSFLGSKAVAQSGDNAEVQLKGKKYLEINLHKLETFERQQKRRQQRLIARLQKQERHLKASLFKSDSLAWKRYNEQGLSPDSLAVLSRRDTALRAARSRHTANSRIDSLRGVTQFLTNAAGNASQLGTSNLYEGQIDQLQGRLDYRKQIDELIAKRTAGLGNIDAAANPAVKRMQKSLFYAKAQIKEYQALADDPGKAEEKAYEFLQGMPGFNEQIDATVNGTNPLAAGGGNLSSADLERMGFQTRRQVGAALQQKLGNNLGAVQQQMGAQLSDWSSKVQDVSKQLAETRQTLAGLRDAKTPGFRVNPMRCIPFRQRFERAYDFQTSRPTNDGKPAMLQLAASIAYRQSPDLSAGIGIAGSMGLGQSWSEVKLTIEGIGLRSFATWNVHWGIAAYAGYERLFKTPALSASRNETQFSAFRSPHQTAWFSESALFGLTKRYKINSKQSGSFNLLYDIWWTQKGLNTPFIIRYSNTF